MGVKAIIFDMDGVLTDSEPVIREAAQRMFREIGHEIPAEEFEPFVGMGEIRYIGGPAERRGIRLDVLAAKDRTYQIYLAIMDGLIRPFPGAVELVLRCRADGLLTAVASSADLIKVDANLRAIGLPPAGFGAVITAEDVTERKPAPDIFLAAAERLGVRPHECCVVEDAVNGVQAARTAGMRCVAVAQTFDPRRLQAADVVRATIADITPADLHGTGAAVGNRRVLSEDHG